MTAIAAPATAPTARSRRAAVRPTVICLLHSKGGVGRSTTAWHLGAELALRGVDVRIEDLDQGAHLTRVFDAHPLGLDNLQLGLSGAADVVILDTAPEARTARSTTWPARTGAGARQRA